MRFIFKSKSPSSGLARIPVYGAKGAPVGHRAGFFAGLVMEHFPLLPVEDEGRLNDPVLRENFLERVFTYHRWQTHLQKPFTRAGMISFHTAHKLQLMAHSLEGYHHLGRLVAQIKTKPPKEFMQNYQTLFMRALAVAATPKKNANVLQHMSGYLHGQLTPDERQELQLVIGDYRAGLLPLIVPITLIKHYVRKFSIAYLEGQTYLADMRLVDR